MNHFERHRHKKAAKNAFSSALLAAASTSSTKTTSVQSISSTSFDIREYSRMMLLTLSKSGSSRSESSRPKKKKPSLKFIPREPKESNE